MVEIAHSKLGASSAYRWLSCPGSVALCEAVPYKQSSLYAAEGTHAHEFAEWCVREQADPTALLGKSFKNLEITEELAKSILHYQEAIYSIDNSENLTLEEKLHLSWIHPDMFGTADAVIREPFGTLTVIDFKYGAGIPVEVENNSQLLFYALGAMAQDEYEHVEMIIVQPRADHKGGPVRRWKVPAQVVHDFAEVLRAGVERVKNEPNRLELGEHCHFCSAKAICPKQKAMVLESMKNAFEIEKSPDVLTMSMSEIVKVIQNKTALKNWIDRVEEHATALLLNGQEIPGLKLATGRGQRQWANDREFQLKFGEKAYKKELYSVVQAEKVFGKDAVKDLIVTLAGRPVATTADDKRKEYNKGAVNDFAKHLEK
jgi:hypothetical protein